MKDIINPPSERPKGDLKTEIERRSRELHRVHKASRFDRHREKASVLTLDFVDYIENRNRQDKAFKITQPGGYPGNLTIEQGGEDFHRLRMVLVVASDRTFTIQVSYCFRELNENECALYRTIHIPGEEESLICKYMASEIPPRQLILDDFESVINRLCDVLIELVSKKNL